MACRVSGPKREFVRIVRSAEGTVGVDETGKRPGRGAYLCRRRACWDTALGAKRDILGHALKTGLGAADREALRQFALGLPAA
ncbi:MAG TPA: YlxR family protein [Dehalococcoidia bacterium]|nr:YlxR family protein [Dehalococcoidia bacterium]